MSSTDASKWWILEAAGIELLSRLKSRGVVDVKWIAAFPDIPGVAAWLCTGSDDRRDILQLELDLQDAVDEALRGAGLPAMELAASSYVVQARETVDRDFEGSWSHAMH